MKNKIVTELEIKALLDSAKKEVGDFGNQLRDLWKANEPPKGMLKSIEALRARLESLKQLSESGVVDSS
jgi:hypothetical protein